MEFKIRKYLRESFLEKFAAVNKKIAKHGVQLSILSVVESSELDPDYYNGGYGYALHAEHQVKYLTYTIDGPELVTNGKGLKFAGSVTLRDGAKIIFNKSAHHQLFNIELRCDHCHSDRKRSNYFVFEDANNELVVIGKNCAKEYFGIDIVQALTYLQNGLQELDDEELRMGGKTFGASLDRVILATYLATKKWTMYISTKKSEESGSAPTGSMVQNIVFTQDPETIQELNTLAEELKGTIKDIEAGLVAKYGSMEITNDFESNTFNSLFYGTNDLRDFISRQWGVVAYALFALMHKPAVKTENAKASGYIGSVGDKIEVEVLVKMIKGLQSVYGTQYLVIFEDKDGNEYKTFSSGVDFTDNELVGKTLKIKGTIKAHEEYREVKATVLTRVKIVAPKEVAA